MSEIRCNNCGNITQPGELVCRTCGSSINSGTTQVQPVPQGALSLDSFTSKLRKQAFAIEPNGEKRLIIAWKGVWNQVTIFLDKKWIGTIPDKKALTSGREFSLPDGSSIKVLLDNKNGLNVLRNGQPLSGSATDPGTQRKSAYVLSYGIIYFVALSTLVLGLVNLIFHPAILEQLGNGLYQVVFGLVFLALGFFVQKKSHTALILAILIYGLDGLVTLISMISQGSILWISVLMMRILFITPMIKGLDAIQELNKKRK
jgi:hypothetical protein